MCGSRIAQVPAPLGETFDPAADALRIIDAYGECGESPASEHIELCPEELQEEDYFALCAEECEEVDNTQPTPVRERDNPRSDRRKSSHPLPKTL